MPAADRWDRNGARKDERRGKIGKPSTIAVRGHVEASSGFSWWEKDGGGEWPDHDCTARQGIMDTIIRERLEVLVIFLLPRLTRTLVHIGSDDLHTGKRALAQTGHKLPRRVDRVLRDSWGRPPLILALRKDRRRWRRDCFATRGELEKYKSSPSYYFVARESIVTNSFKYI